MPEERTIPWRAPWHPVPPEHVASLKAELRREMCAGHVLFGKRVKAIGHRQDCDDFLFIVEGLPQGVAVVHLTYQKEKDPRWPDTAFFPSLEDWINHGLASDAADFES